jgi:membrane dipeptidase
MHLEVEESQNQLIIAKTAEDIRTAKSNGQVAAFLIAEGLRSIGHDISLLRTLYRLGVRSCTFTWNWRNDLADGRLERSAGGLSTFGLEVLREMDRLGMIIDISHISHVGKDEILKLSIGPVIASHVGVKAVYDAPPNLNDRQLEELAAKGGVIGIIFFNDCLSKNQATINDVIDHIEYVANLVGIDYVSLGPDYFDYMKDDPLMNGTWLKVPNSSINNDMVKNTSKVQLNDMYSTTGCATGVENTTKMYNITRAMVAKGFTRKEIRMVLGENCLRVIKEVCG